MSEYMITVLQLGGMSLLLAVMCVVAFIVVVVLPIEVAVLLYQLIHWL